MMLEHLDDRMLWITAVVGGIGALLWFTRRTYRVVKKAAKYLIALVKKLDALADLADYQLNNNGGGSMIDKIESQGRDIAHLTGTTAEIAGSLEQLSGTVTELSDRFEAHLQTAAEANREMWPAVRAVAEAQPPE